SDLPRPIQRTVVERMGLIHRYIARIAINRGGGGRNDLLHFVPNRSLQDVQGAANQNLYRLAWRLDTSRDSQSSLMKNVVRARHRPVYRFVIADAAFDYLQATPLRQTEVGATAADEIIQHTHLGSASRLQVIYDGATDK